MNNNFDIQMMQRCLQLAQNGLGTTYPNPLVGSVITVNEKIIGEGWHQKAGLPHAEVNAINSVANPAMLKEATLYVNLEPCSHFGKTPPCAHKIVAMGIPKVVIGSRDLASHVNGQGIAYLKNHGVEVVENILEQEAYDINRRFFIFHTKKRPYVILKWAETANGYFAPLDHHQKWITSPLAKQLVHRWRTREQAILIGGNTLRIDNPQLNARLWNGTNPIKIILSNQIDTTTDFKIFNGEKTIVINHRKNKIIDDVAWIKVEKGPQAIAQTLTMLHHKGIQSVLVEGGKNILNQFIASDLWDEARLIQGTALWREGIKAPVLDAKLMKTSRKLKHETLNIFKNTSP